MFTCHEIASALKSIDLSNKQREDLRSLYKAKKGFPVERDSGNRVRGETVNSCSLVGSALKRTLGITQGDGMMLIGFLDREDSLWRMNDVFRDAVNMLGWFGPDEFKA